MRLPLPAGFLNLFSNMRLVLFLLLSPAASSLKHSLSVFFTASSGVPNFPDTMIVILISGVPTGYCDDKIKTAMPKQDWMKDLIKDDPGYWSWYIEECNAHLHLFQEEFQHLRKRLNQTGDMHILQKLTHCEWDDETNEVSATHQYGFNGEDFLVFDLETQTWIAAKPQAIITKYLWDADRKRNYYWAHFLKNTCLNIVKKNLHYGKASLLRTELPSVSFLQRTPSSLLCCHATGFYPDTADIFWTRDGKELHEDVVKGEILPNNDGTFQMSVELNLSSVKPEDWERYNCVFQLSGVKEVKITKLDKKAIKTNSIRPNEGSLTVVVVVAATVVILGVAVSAIAFFFRRRKQPVCHSGFQPVNSTVLDTSSSPSVEGPDMMELS